MASANEHTLPKLPYAYDALEPTISTRIMELHHSKHHQTYVTNLNAAEKAYTSAVQNKDIRTQIATQQAIKFHGGGHINHSLFWLNLAPTKEGGGQLADGELKTAIEKQYGSVDNLQKKVNAAALAIQGSGWTWLGYDPATKLLNISTTKDQDPLLTHTPLIGIDMWEHAWYLQRGPDKASYVKEIWDVINWKTAEDRMRQSSGASPSAL